MSAVVELVTFRGHQVRIVRDVVVRNRPQSVVPIGDVADALQYDRESIRQMVTRKRMISRHSTSCIIQAVDGKLRNTLCLTYEGVIGVILNIEPERIADPLRRKWVEDFQEWAVTTLAKVMRGELPTKQNDSPPAPEIVTMLRSELTSIITDIATRVAVAVVQEINRSQSTSAMIASTTERDNTDAKKPPRRKHGKGRLAPESPHFLAFVDKLCSLNLGDTFTRKDVELQLGWNRVQVHRYMTAAERNGVLQVVSISADGTRTYKNPWARRSTLDQIFDKPTPH